jgi:DNA-binding transcriptional ArsR family regulator
VLELGFTAQDLARTRFAFSPLWEVVASIRVLKEPAAHALHLPWISTAAERVRALDLSLLDALIPVPARKLPAFLAPTPTTPVPDIADELDALRAVTADEVKAGIDLLGRPPVLDELYGDPPTGLAKLAETVAAYWETALLPHWPRIRALLEGEVLHRSRRLAEGGAQRLFADLDPAVSWGGDTLVVQRKTPERLRLEGRGLVLVPSVFVWPKVFSKIAPAWQPVLRYPPRGIATLWERGRNPVPDALAAVLGPSRAQLLAELDSPASTSELARRTGITAGGVSQQLSLLRDAGLVTSHRTGRFVLYQRTPAADVLLGAGVGGLSSS